MRFILALILFSLASSVLSNDFIIRTEKTGFYQIPKQDILNLGFKKTSASMSEINISSAKGDHPFFFASGKSKLKKSDSLIFFAESLKGEQTKQHTHDDFNGFKISKTNKNQNYKKWNYKKNAFKALPMCEKLYTNSHYERNKLLIRVNTKEYKETPELWYWEKLNYLMKDGFSVPLDLSKANSLNDVTITTTFRGVNIDRKARDLPNHEVQLKINGTIFSTFQWDGKIQYTSELIKIPRELLKDKDNLITFSVPKRKNGKATIIDISMLDYFVVNFEIDQNKILVSDPLTSNKQCKYQLSDDEIAYSKTNNKYAFNAIEMNTNSEVFIGHKKKLMTAQINELSTIDDNLAEVDYLMITHPLFEKSIKVLADFYRNKGMNVAVINSDKIYQNYSFGVRELYAFKDLIKDTYSQGNGRVKHVLLVGDSSWDWRDNGQNNQYGKWANRQMSNNRNFTNFPHQKNYTREHINRDFIPTGQYHSPEGHSASDNWFVSFIPEKNKTGEDFIPDLAIGRFPVSTSDELDNMIAKTINYTNNSKVGPWKSRVLWITNANKRFQKSSVNTSNSLGDLGVTASNIFPKEMDGDNLKVQETLSNSFDDGNLVVHFLGHGGKSIWRIGPPDLKKNRDLFTLDHISKLNNSKQLPFVMSMSCYSAPFDHPYADSIGEKFIREPDVGAVAILASSWRNTPSSSFSRFVLENIFNHPKNSIGEAILAAKRLYKGRTMLEMYNLLGDPALHLAIPSLNMTSTKKDNEIFVNIDTDSFQGNAKIDTLDKDSNILTTKEVTVSGTDFSFKYDDENPECFQGRIYAWDSKQNIDAMSSFSCEKDKD